jgi:hypothetical protein
LRRVLRHLEYGSIPFLGLIALLAQASGVALVLFPELGALSHDVLKRPAGAWARAPLRMVITPLATAVLGIVIARNLDFGVVAVLLDVLGSVSVIAILRSPIAPAISAGLLPLVLGVSSPWYPLAISVGTVLLAMIAVLQGKCLRRAVAPRALDPIDDVMEAPPATLSWAPGFFGTVALLALLAQWTGLRFIVFPPLVVIGFEMFAHAPVCPWRARPWRLPLACTLASAAGVGLVMVFGPGAIAAMLAMAAGIAILKGFDLRAPPVLAVALLPMVMSDPGPTYVLAVLLGSSLMLLAFAGWQRLLAGIGRLRR